MGNKDIFTENEAKFINKIVSEVAPLATQEALKIIRKEEREKEKNKYDRRLRNTEILLRNYKNFKEHVKNAIYIDNDLSELNNYKFDVENDDERIYLNSILRTKKRTQIMIKHIDNCIDFYTYKCLASNREDIQRRIQVIKMLYINDKGMTFSEIAKELGEVSIKTIQRTKKNAIEELTALFFGVDGIKL